jgi:hypothetical protein
VGVLILGLDGIVPDGLGLDNGNEVCLGADDLLLWVLMALVWMIGFLSLSCQR